MIDARTRAIYVIGGRNGTTYFNDVLVSTDRGARPDSAGGRGGALGGYSACSRGTWVYQGVLGVLEG